MRNLIIPKLVPSDPVLDEPPNQIDSTENTEDSDSLSDSSDHFQLIPEEIFINDDLSDVPNLSAKNKIKEVILITSMFFA